MTLPAMILAAGYGTRLRPLSDLLAKPLVPVGDRPALAHVLDRLRPAGPARIVVNLHHRAGDILAFVRQRAPDVVVSREADLLGTAGGVAHAAEALGAGDVVLWNADILLDLDVTLLEEAHRASGSAQATLVVRRRPAGEGLVGLDGAGRLVRLRDLRLAGEVSGGDFLGVHVVGAELRARLPARGCLVGDVYMPAMARGARLDAFVVDAPFFDVGTVRSYIDANLAWLAKRGERRWAGEGATIDPAVAPEATVVGAGASVQGQGALERCVVWPGATAIAPLRDAVVAPGLIARA